MLCDFDSPARPQQFLASQVSQPRSNYGLAIAVASPGRSLSFVSRSSRPLSLSSGNGGGDGDHTTSSPTPPISPPSVAGYRVELSPSGGVVHNRVTTAIFSGNNPARGSKFATSSPTLAPHRPHNLKPQPRGGGGGGGPKRSTSTSSFSCLRRQHNSSSSSSSSDNYSVNLDGCYATRMPEVLAKERRTRKRQHRHHHQHNHYPHFYRPSQDLSPGSDPDQADLNLDLHLVVVPPSPLAQPARPHSPRQKPDSLLLQSRSTPEYLTAALTPSGD